MNLVGLFFFKGKKIVLTLCRAPVTFLFFGFISSHRLERHRHSILFLLLRFGFIYVLYCTSCKHIKIQIVAVAINGSKGSLFTTVLASTLHICEARLTKLLFFFAFRHCMRSYTIQNSSAVAPFATCGPVWTNNKHQQTNNTNTGLYVVINGTGTVLFSRQSNLGHRISVFLS